MSQEWNDGLKDFFFLIEQYIKENDHYDGCKNTCFAYKMLKLEEHISWEKIDNHYFENEYKKGDKQVTKSPKSSKSDENEVKNDQITEDIEESDVSTDPEP